MNSSTTTCPTRHHGDVFADAEIYRALQSCGEETKIFRHAVVVNPARVTIGRGSQIDDFVFLGPCESISIGDRVHVASYTGIGGGGEVVFESYSGLASGCRIISGSEDWRGGGLTNPCIPPEFRRVRRSRVVIRKHALLFTNVVVFPGVEIGEGAVVSAGTIVDRSLEPWGLYRTEQGKVVRVLDRKKERIAVLESEMIAKYGY